MSNDGNNDRTYRRRNARKRRETAEMLLGVGGAAPFPEKGAAVALRVLGRGTELALDFSRAQELCIGRDPTAADLCLNDPSISRSHALVSPLPGSALLVKDCGSVNGVFQRFHARGRDFFRTDELITHVGHEFLLGSVWLMPLDHEHRQLASELAPFFRRDGAAAIDTALAAASWFDVLVLKTNDTEAARSFARILHERTARRRYDFTEPSRYPDSDAAIDEVCTKAGCGTVFVDLTRDAHVPPRFARNLFDRHYHLWPVIASPTGSLAALGDAVWNRLPAQHITVVELAPQLRLVS